MGSIAFPNPTEGNLCILGNEALSACLVQQGDGASRLVQLPAGKFRFHYGAFRDDRRHDNRCKQENTQNDWSTHGHISRNFGRI